MSKKVLIFDFDLTLADASLGIFQCVNHAMEQLSFNTFDYDTIKRVIGHSLPETFKLLTGNQSLTKAKEFTEIFTKQADKVMNLNTVLFPEVYQVIPKLKELGYITGIVSTKFRYRIAGVLYRENMAECFDFIVGGEDVKEHKPHPEGLLMAVAKGGFEKYETVYIGDSLVDLETADSAEIDFIGVLTGTTAEDDFKARHAKVVIQDLNQLFSVL